MAIVFIQFVLTAAACFGLWRFWRAFSGVGKTHLIITAGFLIRALLGEGLFWISWLRLPVARSLQLGNGFWFFAVDGPIYLNYSWKLIESGPMAILFVTNGFKSRIYTQAFTVFAAAFGVVGSVAILFNCLAYLATCAIIQRTGARDSRMNVPRLAALIAVAFGPGTILWSLQALKDTFFLLLIVAMIGACFRWQELWSASGPRMWRLMGSALVMLIAIYAIGGTRWYFAVIVLAAYPFFFVLAAIKARPRRLPALLAGTLLFVLLSQAFCIGGSTDIPWQIRRLLAPQPSAEERFIPAAVPGLIEESRAGFEHTPGATRILTGPALASESPAPASESLRSEEKQSATGMPRLDAPTLVTGFAAMFLPKALAQAIGLIHIGGGRGFWFFAEIDTLVFDAVLLFALIYCTRALRSWARVTPLFIWLALVFLMTAAPMMYAVTNFGTLFRLRQMVYLAAALLPLTLAPRSTGDYSSS